MSLHPCLIEYASLKEMKTTLASDNIPKGQKYYCKKLNKYFAKMAGKSSTSDAFNKEFATFEHDYFARLPSTIKIITDISFPLEERRALAIQLTRLALPPATATPLCHPESGEAHPDTDFPVQDSNGILQDAPATRYTETLAQYKAGNRRWRKWARILFKVLRAWLTAEAVKVPLATIEDIVLTGSRNSGLAYPESDLECAVIVANDTTLAQAEALVQVVASFFVRCNLTDTKPFTLTTKAGLPLMIAKDVRHINPAKPTMFRLEATVRTRATQAAFVENLAGKMAFWSPQDRLNYINAMRAAAADNNEPLKAWLKRWLKFLPEDGSSALFATG